MGGSLWFRRFCKELKQLSPHLKLVRISYGYYRIYFVNGGEGAYIMEVWKWLPRKGYEIEYKDIELVSQKYYEEYEDQLEMNRLMKNFVEGYYDAIDTLKTRLYMLRNDKEFRATATAAYRQWHVR